MRNIGLIFVYFTLALALAALAGWSYVLLNASASLRVQAGPGPSLVLEDTGILYEEGRVLEAGPALQLRPGEHELTFADAASGKELYQLFVYRAHALDPDELADVRRIAAGEAETGARVELATLAHNLIPIAGLPLLAGALLVVGFLFSRLGPDGREA